LKFLYTDFRILFYIKRGMNPGYKGFIACGDGMNQLTHQEQKIVTLIAQGLTNKEIAQRLGSSPFTVRNQVKVIIRKLKLKNRVQVAYLIGQHTNIDEIVV
jgi:DNA-binding NarL/FixJ family response regulator